MSAFKKLYTQMILAGGDESKIQADLRKKDLQVFVKETEPYFLVSDSYFYVPAYFTPACASEFKSKFSNTNWTDLEAKVIVITKWNLELKKVDSASVFTSYAGVECRLIVHSFKPLLKEKLHPVRYPTNLYRDDEFKTTVQAFRHSQLRSAADSRATSMAPLGGGKGQVSQGVVTGGAGEWSFKQGNTKVIPHGTKASKAAGSSAAPKVKGGVRSKAIAKAGKQSALAKAMKQTPRSGKTPSRVPGKESARPKTAGTPDAGKKSHGPGSKLTMKQYLKFRSQKGKGSKK